jgi:hypothetical protein
MGTTWQKHLLLWYGIETPCGQSLKKKTRRPHLQSLYSESSAGPFMRSIDSAPPVSLWCDRGGFFALYGITIWAFCRYTAPAGAWGAIFASACAAPAVDSDYMRAHEAKCTSAGCSLLPVNTTRQDAGEFSHLSETECLTTHWTLELRKSTGTQLGVDLAQITLCALAPETAGVQKVTSEVIHLVHFRPRPCL